MAAGPNYMGCHMLTPNPRDKANMLVMTSRPNEVRNVSADFDATGRPYLSVVLKVLSEGAKLTRLLYMGDFMEAWYAFRAVSRGFRLAADSLWWETCRHLVNLRVNAVMSGGFFTHDSNWITRNLLPLSPSSEP